jgi:hypothetical protein
MRLITALFVWLSFLAACGCGSGDVVIPKATSDSVTGLIRPILEGIAESGDRAAFSELKSYIQEDLASVDQAKSDALMKDFKELQGLSGANRIKAKAKEMLAKL